MANRPWRVAKSIDILRKEIDAKFPNRNKASDGTIGNAEHQSRSSDHNPWIKTTDNGKVIYIVSALDITHDPAHGIDSHRLAEALLKSRDGRIKYVISNGKIASGAEGPNPWVWRRYTGTNQHTMHMHLSVEDTKPKYDNNAPWDLEIGPQGGTTPPFVNRPVLKRGDKGADVRFLQEELNKDGYNLKVDGDFGDKTDKAVRLFQKINGIEQDGIIGPYSWEKLRN